MQMSLLGALQGQSSSYALAPTPSNTNNNHDDRRAKGPCVLQPGVLGSNPSLPLLGSMALDKFLIPSYDSYSSLTKW